MDTLQSPVLQESFKIFDFDKDGNISVDELGAIMRKLGMLYYPVQAMLISGGAQRKRPEGWASVMYLPCLEFNISIKKLANI